MFFFYLVVPDVGIVGPAHPVGVGGTAGGLLTSRGLNIEFELRPAMLDTSARSGIGTVERTYNSDVLGVGVGEGDAPGSVAAITLRQQVRS